MGMFEFVMTIIVLGFAYGFIKTGRSDSSPGVRPMYSDRFVSGGGDSKTSTNADINRSNDHNPCITSYDSYNSNHSMFSDSTSISSSAIGFDDSSSISSTSMTDNSLLSSTDIHTSPMYSHMSENIYNNS